MTSSPPETEQKWFIYMIRTAKNALYTGITTNVERRFQEHQHSKKGAKALRGKGPLTLVWTKEVENKSAALKLEAAVKKLTKRQKEALVKRGYTGLNIEP